MRVGLLRLHTAAVIGVLALSCGPGTLRSELTRVSGGLASAEGSSAERWRVVAPRGTTLSVGDGHLCVIVDGEAWCWGDGHAPNALETTWGSTPLRLPGGPFVDVASGRRGTCACSVDGDVECWGLVTLGPLDAVGTPPTMRVRAPRCAAVSAGYASGCSLTRAGDVWCWPTVGGSWVAGSPAQRAWPEAPLRGRPLVTGADGVAVLERVELNPEASPARSVAVSSRRSCAIVAPAAGLTSGEAGGAPLEVRCWGDNDYGALSDGVLRRGVVSVNLDDPEVVAVGDAGSCAGTPRGVTCWGGHAVAPSDPELAACLVLEAQQRDPDDMPFLSEPGGPCRFPAREIAGVGHVREMGVGEGFACAINDADELVCWGREPREGRVMPSRMGWTTPRLSPTVFARGVRTMDMEHTSGCWLDEGNGVSCWGRLSGLPTAGGAPRRDAVWLPPGVRVARVIDGDVRLCDEEADVDPCAT